MSVTDDFQQMLQQEQTAHQHFLEGDTEPQKALWSHTDDVTLCGGWGAYEKGWEQVGQRLDWAAARFREGHTTREVLSLGISGDLAYTVWIDRDQVRFAGRDEFTPMTLRVTYIFRRAEGIWKIIHRHADSIIDKTGP